MKRLWLLYPFDDLHAMYCSAFVRHCYTTAGKDFIGPEVSVSNLPPDDVVQARSKVGAMKIF
jgi:hypothetical protein